MKHVITAGMVAAAALGIGQANAGVTIQNAGKPACVENNPPAAYTRGETGSNVQGNYYNRATGELIATNPFTQWGDFTYAPYSFVSGALHDAAVMRFDYATPQTELDIVWGTIDPGNVLEFESGGQVVARVSGTAFASRVGVPLESNVYAKITLTGGLSFRRLKLRSNVNSFEFNIAGCSEQ